jgi:hypothetical protein
MTFGLRIRVDFNRLTGGGNVIGSIRRATGAIAVGDVVVAVQPGEDMERFARVLSIDESSGRVTLEVNWNSNPSEWAPAARDTAASLVDLQFVPSNLLYRVSPTGSSGTSQASRQPLNA